MSDQPYTITPDVIINADGSESISYETAHVDNGQHTERVLNDFHHSQDGYLYVDEKTGKTHHQYEDYSLEDLDPYKPEPIEQDEFVPITDEDQSYIFEQIGGAETYNEMLEWASDSLPEDIVDEFNQAIDTGYIEFIIENVNALYKLYIDNAFRDYSEEDSEPEQQQMQRQDDFDDAEQQFI